MTHLTKEEEYSLAKTGGTEARNKLVLNQMPYIYKQAIKKGNSPEVIEELVQIATLALTQAAHRYDPDYGIRFFTWAKFVIHGAMTAFFNGNGSADIRYRATKECDFDFDSLSTKGFVDAIEQDEIIARLRPALADLTEDENIIMNTFLHDEAQTGGLVAKLAKELGLKKGGLNARRRKIVKKIAIQAGLI